METSESESGRCAAAQAKAARVLATLTEQQIDAKLPVASWHLSAFDTELSGNVTALEYDHDNNIYRDDEKSIKNVQKWGRSFAIEPEYSQWQTEPGYGEIAITINESGVIINIWACITVNHATNHATNHAVNKK